MSQGVTFRTLGLRGSGGAQQKFLVNDPLVPFRRLRVATAFSFLDGVNQISAEGGEIAIPVFLAQPSADKVFPSCPVFFLCFAFPLLPIDVFDN